MRWIDGQAYALIPEGLLVELGWTEDTILALETNGDSIVVRSERPATI